MNPTKELVFKIIANTEVWIPFANEIIDLEDRLILSGKKFNTLPSLVKNLIDFIENNGLQSSLALRLDGDIIQPDTELSNYFTTQKIIVVNWDITILKTNINNLPSSSPQDLIYLFFLSIDSFLAWLKGVNVFKPDNFVNRHKNGVKIIVKGIDKHFGNKFFQILSYKEIQNEVVFAEENLPSSETIRKQVHIIANSVEINPAFWTPTIWSDIEPIDSIFAKNALKTLSSSIIQELFENDEITIKGLKRLRIPLHDNSDEIRKIFVNTLKNSVRWAYENRTDTRIQLLTDRFSLDFDTSKSLLSNLYINLKDALEQAKEQYKFVVLDRKDEYFKELRGVIEEVQSQAVSYTDKIRSLQSNLFRDVLASILLFSFGLISKTNIEEINKTFENPYVLLLFKGLGIYFIVSFIIQLAISFTDLSVSNKERVNWMKTTRNYLSKEEIEKIFDDAVKTRKKSFIWSYGIGLLLYFLVVLFCFNMKSIFQFFSNSLG